MPRPTSFMRDEDSQGRALKPEQQVPEIRPPPSGHLPPRCRPTWYLSQGRKRGALTPCIRQRLAIKPPPLAGHLHKRLPTPCEAAHERDSRPLRWPSRWSPCAGPGPDKREPALPIRSACSRLPAHVAPRPPPPLALVAARA